MRLARKFLSPLGCLIFTLLALTPLSAQVQAKKPLPQKYLKEMATLYESLAITDIGVTEHQTTNTMFRPFFKITNQTDRALEVPLRPGVAPDRGSILGVASCKLRRIGENVPKNEPVHLFTTSAAEDIYLLIQPKATVGVDIPTRLSLKGMGLQTGDYEITLEYGLPNGPKVKPVVKKIRIENTEAGLSTKQRTEQIKSDKDDYIKYCRALFNAVQPYEVTLSADKVTSGAPLEASLIINKIEGQSLPDAFIQGKQPHTLALCFSLIKTGGAKKTVPAWRDALLLSPYTLNPLKKEGVLRKTFQIETRDLAPGNYDFVVEVSRGGEAENAPRPQKLRVIITK